VLAKCAAPQAPEEDRMSERTRIGSASELREKGQLIGKVGALPVVAVWLD